MEANKRSINDIFNQNRILEIPFFQRSYVWDEPQWERFLVDMEFVSHNNRPYFLGSVILKQQHTTSGQSVGDKRIVIDGQQRLTTLNIFFKVMNLKSNNEYLPNLFRLPMRNNDIALLHNRNDIKSFNQVLNLEKGEPLEGEDKIIGAYNYFLEKIDLKKLNFLNILTNVMFVGIDLSYDEDEQQIFDTINSLGVKLTTAELLKNYLFGRNEISFFNEYWGEVFENDAETKDYWDVEITTGRFKRQLIDLFFYSFLQIKVLDPAYKISNKEDFTKVDGLFNSYKRFIQEHSIDKVQLIKEVKEYALIFKRFFNPQIKNDVLSEDSHDDRINLLVFSLENTTLITYVLYLLKNVVNVIERNKIFKYLESYIMRRMICQETSRNYNQLFSERLISNQILTAEALKSYIETQSDKVNFMPSLEDLEKAFHASRLINRQAAGVLYLIESKIRNRKFHSTSLFGLDHYTLEHVMPKKWINHWPLLQGTTEFRDKALQTLGNLTLLSAALNISVRDSDWATKLQGRGKHEGLTKFAQGLDTFSPYLNHEHWSEETIKERANFLFSKAKTVWGD